MGNLAIWLARHMSGNGHGTVRAGSIIATLGVAFAVAVMEITMAVSFGFKAEITDKLSHFVPPLTVTAPLNGETSEITGFIEDSPEIRASIAQIVPDAQVVPVLTLQGLLKTDADFGAILLKAYPDDYEARFEKSVLTDGTWLDADDNRGIVLSAPVAETLNIGVGDRLTFCYLTDGGLKARPLTVTGLYRSGLSEFDDLVAYVPQAFLRKIYHADEHQAVALEVRGISLKNIDAVADALSRQFRDEAFAAGNPAAAFRVERITEQGALYLNWLELLDTNVVVIFILMALVATCTLLSSLFIQVLDKVKTIGLLRALGSSSAVVSRLFVIVMLRRVGWGLVLGNILGLGFIITQQLWHWMPLDPTMYYVDSVPVAIDALTVLLINIGALTICWLILLLPARIATKLSPASTLRFD